MWAKMLKNETRVCEMPSMSICEGQGCDPRAKGSHSWKTCAKNKGCLKHATLGQKTRRMICQ
jgi:hypothetical protein